jgi:signal transduction histidine kinase
MGFRMPRRSVRLRLTMLYGSLFLLSGACLLVITYFLVAQQLSARLQVSSAAAGAGSAATAPITVPETGGSIAGVSGGGVSCYLTTNGTPQAVQPSRCTTYLQNLATGQRNAEMNELLAWSGVALGIMAVASVGLGWMMAGRVLRPLRTITAAARHISASSLHKRLALTGPDDELKELGDTFDQLLVRLEASFRAQRQFVSNASHELRTPLARQRTLLEVAVRDRHATPETLRAACERALAAGEQQERLIAALLTLARSERGLDRFEPLDLNSVAAAVVGARKEEADARGVSIYTGLAPAPALGDSGLAERMVANLADNAIRHNVPGGRVEVVTGTMDGRPFLAVTNTGPVIPEDDIGRLFRPFQRMTRDRVGGDRVGGLGLGLPIVVAIAAAHEATVRALPAPAGGMCVEVLFPPVPARAQRPLPAEDASPPALAVPA